MRIVKYRRAERTHKLENENVVEKNTDGNDSLLYNRVYIRRRCRERRILMSRRTRLYDDSVVHVVVRHCAFVPLDHDGLRCASTWSFVGERGSLIGHEHSGQRTNYLTILKITIFTNCFLRPGIFSSKFNVASCLHD